MRKEKSQNSFPFQWKKFHFQRKNLFENDGKENSKIVFLSNAKSFTFKENFLFENYRAPMDIFPPKNPKGKNPLKKKILHYNKGFLLEVTIFRALESV
jgi:hypothetical protein